MRTTLIQETPFELRQRVKIVKQMLKEYKKKYSNIGIVSHGQNIKFTLAR